MAGLQLPNCDPALFLHIKLVYSNISIRMHPFAQYRTAIEFLTLQPLKI